jgi:hypothetical protein
MACPLNRNRFAGSGYQKESSGESAALNDRLKEMMAVREAQDGGNFKPTTSWSSVPAGTDKGLDAFFVPSPVDPNKDLNKLKK